MRSPAIAAGLPHEYRTSHCPIRLATPPRAAGLSTCSLTHRYAPLATPGGLTALVKAEAITDEERDLLLETTTGTVGRGIMGHAALLGWLAVLLERGVREGTLGGASGRSSLALQHSFQGKLMDLRAAYGSIADELSGRMPLAYAQLVQILCDMLVLFSPVALVGSVGGWGAVVGTGCMTLFYSSVRLALQRHLSLPPSLPPGSAWAMAGEPTELCCGAWLVRCSRRSCHAHAASALSSRLHSALPLRNPPLSSPLGSTPLFSL
jgi:hypothetical protein